MLGTSQRERGHLDRSLVMGKDLRAKARSVGLPGADPDSPPHPAATTEATRTSDAGDAGTPPSPAAVRREQVEASS